MCYIRRWAVTTADCDWGLLCESRRTVATRSQQTGGGLCVCNVGSSLDTETFHKQVGENRKRWYIPWSLVYTLREEETVSKYKLHLHYVITKYRKNFDLYHPLGRRNIQLHFQPRSKRTLYWQYIWGWVKKVKMFEPKIDYILQFLVVDSQWWWRRGGGQTLKAEAPLHSAHLWANTPQQRLCWRWNANKQCHQWHTHTHLHTV